MNRVIIQSLFLFALVFCGVECGALSPSESIARATRDFERIYSGNPLSSKLSTYVYLCRKGEGSCDGISIGVITADESNEEFVGFDPTRTKDVVSTLSISFGGEKDCIRPSNGNMCIRYTYNYERYRLWDSSVGSDKKLLDNDNYLHDPDGNENFLRGPLVSLSDYESARLEDSEASIVHILRTALFRWKIDGETLSEILTRVGVVGERSPCGKMIIPRYSYVNLGGDNCATMSLRILSAIGICGREWRVNHLALGAGMAIGVADGAFVGSSFGPLGMLCGAVVGGGVAAAEMTLVACAKKALYSAPEEVIDTIIDIYADDFKKHGDEFPFFRIVAHDEEESEEFRASEDGTGERVAHVKSFFSTYNRFELKSIKDAVKYKIRIGKGRCGVFSKDNFRRKDSECVIL